MLKNLWVMLIILLATTSSVFAGWECVYGDVGFDYGRSVVQVSDGSGYVVAGTIDLDDMNQGACLIKTDPLGEMLWIKIYGGEEGDGFSVQQTVDEGYVVAGCISNDIYLVKTDSLGDTLWTKKIDLGGIDIAYSVQQTTDSGYILTGTTLTSSYNIFLIKANAYGDTLWTKIYDRSSDSLEYLNDFGCSVQQTADGSYVITGSMENTPGTMGNVCLVKTDSCGNILWTRIYDYGSNGGAYSVQQTIDGGYIIAGYTYVSGVYNAYLIKANSFGDTLWTKTYGGSNESRGYSVQQTIDGDYILAGYTYSTIINSDIYLVRTNPSGDTLWTRTYDQSGEFDAGYSVIQTSDNGYLVAGTSYCSRTSYDIYLVKTDSLGYSAIKEDHRRPRSSLLSVQPNPFNVSATISYKLSEPSLVNLSIFDVQGRLIAELISGNQEAGNYMAIWDANNAPSGIYFCKLVANSEQWSIKMMLIK